MKTLRTILMMGAAGIAIAGCMSTPKSDIEPDWRSGSEVPNLSPVHVLHDGDRVFMAARRNVYVLDGSNGRTINSMRDSLQTFLIRESQFQVDGRLVELNQFFASGFNMFPMPEQNVVFVFDFQGASEIVMALDSVSGEVLWASSDYKFSLNQYRGLVDRGADMIGSRLANMLGATHTAEDEEERREREVSFLNTVMQPVPDSDLVAFKTFSGLYLLNTRTGEQVAHVSDFRGAGLADVQRIGRNDLLVVAGARNITDTLGIATAYDVARISMDGEVCWKSEHSGARTENAIIAGDVVLVNGAPTEAFDLQTGQKLWQNDVRRYWPEYHHVLVADGYAYFASDLTGRVGRVEESKIWKQNLRTGNVAWETSVQRGYYTALSQHGDYLVAAGRGNMFAENRYGMQVLNRNTGELHWQTPELARSSAFSNAPSFTHPLVVNNRVYVADYEHLYSYSLATGDSYFQVNHADLNTDGVVALAAYGNSVLLIGRDAVVKADASNGSVQQHVRTERTGAYQLMHERLVLSQGRGITQTVDLASLEASPVVRHTTARRYFGNVDDAAFVTGNGRHKISVDDDGRVLRFSFDAVPVR